MIFKTTLDYLGDELKTSQRGTTYKKFDFLDDNRAFTAMASDINVDYRGNRLDKVDVVMDLNYGGQYTNLKVISIAKAKGVDQAQ